MIFPIDVDLPEEVLKKYKPTAWRPKQAHEIRACCVTGQPHPHSEGNGWRCLILEPIKQYREPVLPTDAGKLCEFSNDNINWTKPQELCGYVWNLAIQHKGPVKSWLAGGTYHSYARIEVGADIQNDWDLDHGPCPIISGYDPS